MDIVTSGRTLYLAGDFDVRSTMHVRSALRDRLSEHDDVVVDMSGVDSVDVTALRVLAAATRQAGHEGRRVRLRGCSGPVRRMLHMTRLIRLVEVEREPVSA